MLRRGKEEGGKGGNDRLWGPGGVYQERTCSVGRVFVVSGDWWATWFPILRTATSAGNSLPRKHTSRTSREKYPPMLTGCEEDEQTLIQLKGGLKRRLQGGFATAQQATEPSSHCQRNALACQETDADPDPDAETNTDTGFCSQ